MTHHTCTSCQRGFIATSLDEAMDEYSKMDTGPDDDFETLVEDNKLAYAQFCPYCGEKTVEAR